MLHCGDDPPAESSSGTTARQPTPEEELLWLVNESRAEHGLPGLAWRDDVAWVAEDHSEDMNASGELRHNDAYFSDESRRRHGARTLGENVAYGPSVREVHDALMASPSHRDNILDPRFSVIGIGIVRGTDRWWVTEDFLEPR